MFEAVTVKAVMFDLDDTLFDHAHSSRAGLVAVRECYEPLRRPSLLELERDHSIVLEELHRRVLDGLLSMEQSRIQRFRRLFLMCGEEISVEAAEVAAVRYREAFMDSRRPVPSAEALLTRLRGDVKIVVVSNNMLAEQRRKLRHLRLDSLVDELVVSEEVGSAKPNPEIFRAALRRADCQEDETVMVGDSWENDIVGATRLGIRAVWLNRHGAECPDRSLADELHSFEPPENVVSLLLEPR